MPDEATFPVLLDGYTDLPQGKIANVVTFFERTAPPAPARPHPGFSVRPVRNPATAWYRALYRRIGEDWLWFSRAVMPEADLAALLSAPTTEVLVLEKDGADVGLAEIDFTVPAEAEIVTFGVVPEATGTGAARALMDETLHHAFRPGVGRVWLHTCSFDHPAAVRFYLRSGFSAWKYAIEVSEDPRASGALPMTAAPHVPFLKG